MKPVAAIVERLHALSAEWYEMCGNIHEPLAEAADAIEQLHKDHSDFIRAVLSEPDGVDIANRLTQRVLVARTIN